jgi:hypothetical protein
MSQEPKFLFLVIDDPDTFRLLQRVLQLEDIHYASLDFLSTKTVVSKNQVELSIVDSYNSLYLMNLFEDISKKRFLDSPILLVHVPLSIIEGVGLVSILRQLLSKSDVIVQIIGTFKSTIYRRWLTTLYDNMVINSLLKVQSKEKHPLMIRIYLEYFPNLHTREVRITSFRNTYTLEIRESILSLLNCTTISSLKKIKQSRDYKILRDVIKEILLLKDDQKLSEQKKKQHKIANSKAVVLMS